MKIKFLSLPFILSVACLAASCSKPIGSRSYHVVFEDAVELKTDTIESKGVQIGKVLNKKLTAQQKVLVRIAIDPDYIPLMKDNVVFYVKDDTLIFDTLWEEGTTELEEDAEILGFSSAGDLNVYKALSKVGDISKKTKKAAEDLYNEIMAELDDEDEASPDNPES